MHTHFSPMNEYINGWMEGNSHVGKWKPKSQSKSLRAGSDLRNGLTHFTFVHGKLGPSE